jgi:hypothetical protein
VKSGFLIVDSTPSPTVPHTAPPTNKSVLGNSKTSDFPPNGRREGDARRGSWTVGMMDMIFWPNFETLLLAFRS